MGSHCPHIVQQNNHAIWIHVFTKKELVVFEISKNVLDLLTCSAAPVTNGLLLYLVSVQVSLWLNSCNLWYTHTHMHTHTFIHFAITVVPFPTPLTPLHPAHPLPPTFPPYSSCPSVIFISSLASTFPTLFLPSPCIFHLSSMLLILCTFTHLSPSHSLIDNPPCHLHLYGSVSVLVVCLVCSRFCFMCGR